MPNITLGQHYKTRIQAILSARGLLPLNLQGHDAGFVHRDRPYFITVRGRKVQDYGARNLEWNRHTGWRWAFRDEMTDLYDFMGVLKMIDQSFIPRKYTKFTNDFTLQDKKYDHTQFEKNSFMLDDAGQLYEFYANRNCYYIQVEDKGFYYLKQDIARLGVSQFRPKLTLRMQALLNQSNRLNDYNFLAVLQAPRGAIAASQYDLEAKPPRKFPPLL